MAAVELMMDRCSYKTDDQDSCGSTPLMDSLRAGYIDVAEILIERHKVRNMSFLKKCIPFLLYKCKGEPDGGI